MGLGQRSGDQLTPTAVVQENNDRGPNWGSGADTGRSRGSEAGSKISRI